MREERLTLSAPAKINLFLRVVGRRHDGYHLLATLMQKVTLYDEVELRSRAGGVRLHCHGGGVPADHNNLVCKAAVSFLQATRGRRAVPEAGVDVILTKRIPVAAGLGGGSSDAAATLVGLNELYQCGCSASELAEIGLRLGADVPFFLAEAPAAIATGIGEVVQPVEPLDGYSILLVNPGFPLSTRWVFQHFALTEKENAGKMCNSLQGVVAALGLDQSQEKGVSPVLLMNDLETVTFSRYPEVERLKEELLLNGADMALMSGSGPTIFGLFADRQGAVACYDLCKHRFHHTYLVSPVGKK